MKILSTNVYVGPNIYANFPVIRHEIDLGVLENWPSAKIGDKFIDQLVESLPGLQEHGCSYREKGGFIRRLREDEGTWMGHIWEHVILELQSMAGSDVTFGRTRSTGEVGHYNMVYEYKQKDVGLRAMELARDLLISILPENLKKQVEFANEDFDFEYEKVRFIKFAQSKEFGPSTASLVEAAKKRDIPYIRLNDQSLVQFGYGKYQQRIRATITGKTTSIAVDLSCDKEQTNTILSSLGLPVPKQRMVTTEEGAVRAAKILGFPLVVKPLDGNHGRGISINLKTIEEIKEAFVEANKVSRYVLLEQYVTGFDHRMLVVDGKLIAVAKRVPGHVVGDGKHTIAELVEIVNQDPRRGIGHEKVLTKLELDYQARTLLRAAGYDENTILKDGEVFYLRSTANLSTGGTAIDVTDIVHPDNRDMAERAIKAIGLDVGGVDFLIDDISQSYHDIGGAICECNAAPGFRMHVAPSEGKPRDVAGAVIDMLIPREYGNARIPIAAITGTNGKTTTSRMVAHMWKNAGKVVGLTTTDGVYINGKLTVAGDTTGPASAQMVLKDPSVEMAILETARGGLLRSGLGYDYCNVGACLNISADHLGLKGINTLEDLAKVKSIVVEAAKDVAVLNADDPNVLKMSAKVTAKHIFYVTMNPEHALVKQHIRAGGKACIIEKGVNGDMITIFDNHIHIPVLWTHLIPATMEGKAIHNVQNSMFAIAICYSMGMSLDDMRDGLRTFVTSFYQAPGRMNWFEEHPFKVLMDYGHNPAAIKLVSQMIMNMEFAGRKICVLASPGDRRDEDIAELAKTAAPYYDYFICKRDDDTRGRAPDEVPRILKEALIEAGISADNIEIIESEKEAVDAALNMAEEGDLVVIFADKLKRTWKQIIYFNKDQEFDGKDKKLEKQEMFSASVIAQDPSLSEEISQVIKAGIISDDSGVRVVYHEEDND
ncbi:cyanophycin synthetase [Francisella tularensis subsp. novicida]|uniref:Cyanophycin synthetase n=2 Tax=Francisella tularensis TaxID=263 RepID=A0A6I4RM37_FRATU|nr:MULTISPECIES: cyanophycin synthetase [Francisella]ABK89998.1 cyanophycin synthetase [Francisella tularensis subsp. novicida U112]AJI60479.1 cyanophycin synthetase [Francisella tularensis subsp. novicida U112]APC95662.1 cyanophycin synthetase [Francisella tularensis subsp. novicida]EDX19520.1 cyanophycin synthetase [Francisella tularensis subsp. novicida FTE]MBK2035552.1 cyanophycin synthetase [Francisella tularensis subsp. novicida]